MSDENSPQVQGFDAFDIPVAAQAQAAPVALWCGWHPDKGYNLNTVATTQQTASSYLMMSGIAGNHGWSVQPLYASPVRDTETEKIRLQLVRARAILVDIEAIGEAASLQNTDAIRCGNIAHAGRIELRLTDEQEKPQPGGYEI